MRPGGGAGSEWFDGASVDAASLTISAWTVARIMAMGTGVDVTAERLRRGLVVLAVGVVLLTLSAAAGVHRACGGPTASGAGPPEQRSAPVAARTSV